MRTPLPQPHIRDSPEVLAIIVHIFHWQLFRAEAGMVVNSTSLAREECKWMLCAQQFPFLTRGALAVRQAKLQICHVSPVCLESVSKHYFN